MMASENVPSVSTITGGVITAKDSRSSSVPPAAKKSSAPLVWVSFHSVGGMTYRTSMACFDLSHRPSRTMARSTSGFVRESESKTIRIRRPLMGTSSQAPRVP